MIDNLVMAARRSVKRSYHHGQLRSTLIAAAIDLLGEHGVSGLSLRECARRAGVSHAAPYRHFADKRALLAAIARQGFEELAAVGAAAMEGVDDPRDRLDAYGIAYVRFAIEHPVVFRLMFTGEWSDAGEADAGEADAGEDAAVDGGAFDLLVATASAAVGPGVDGPLAAAAAWSLPHGLAMLLLDGRIPAGEASGPEGAEALARAIFALWRGPLAGPRAPKRAG
ncbi:MAG: TetR/AcrR family transcriptional regulator [Myxococcales bacterium]|nr:TetR/AcrR family transcriptional regulator [Myxococcales bacterium]